MELLALLQLPALLLGLDDFGKVITNGIASSSIRIRQRRALAFLRHPHKYFFSVIDFSSCATQARVLEKIRFISNQVQVVAGPFATVFYYYLIELVYCTLHLYFSY
jgi:hypothetical protein